MNRSFAAIAGLVLVAAGFAMLVPVTLLPLAGWDAWAWGMNAMWSVPVGSIGVLFMLAPLLAPARRWLGVLFVPGMTVMTAGSLLLLSGLLQWWDIWGLLWPMLVLAAAMGFGLGALWTRRIWLAIPAIIIGMNGLTFQFCAFTGLWHWWSFLWLVEPVAVGLVLIMLSLRVHSGVLSMVGLLMCGFSIMLGAGLLVLVSGMWSLAGTLAGIALISIGAVALLWNFIAPRRLQTAGRALAADR